ncbi:hypothetical protein HYPSUDRAFT_64613 [Hypholoma sublateritium FD-334 SS-4]|uniref:Homeobox domain-containing protein n=1 Tax=Hypholoma sublateritium (strain FD-334 SS-4) TaxID=945553 RepID=A0A0D2Q2V7_HYPSF|nr:hypothetical protein HYPSUDRAFT_64613 [Hypholoma sublateritium FD-334 SS-4]
MSAIDVRVRKALSSLESGFFSALRNGLEALVSFDTAWLSFTTEVETCIDSLQEDTKSKIYSFATTANIISSMLLEVDTAVVNIYPQFREDISKILPDRFRELTIQDKSEFSRAQTNASYIPMAYKWLLENLHNPYPTKEARLEISESSDSSLKDVDAWFIDARKRIGWNQLRREHFPKRGDLIKAATCFFKQSQAATLVSKSLRSTLAANRYHEFAYEFVQMEACARELYSGKLSPSEFAEELEKPGLTNVQNLDTHDQERPGRGRPGLKADQRSSYPSPEHSPGRDTRSLSPLSPPTPLYASIRNEDSGRKRKRSISPAETLSDGEQSVSHTAKRSRINVAESLPSPATSVDDSLPEETSHNALIPTSPIISAQPSGKRKRALSDVDDRVQKRPHVIPRTQRISFSDPIRPAERLTGMNLEDLIVDVFGPNNEYAYGAAPATSPSFDEINQFEIEFQYDFPYDIMPEDGLYRDESESPGDTPEMDNVALPQPQVPIMNHVNDMTAYDVGNVASNSDIPLAWAGFNMTSAAPCSEFWQAEQALTNNASMLASDWPDDCMPIGLENLPPQTFWSHLDDISNNATDYYNLPTTSLGTLFPNFTPTKTPEQLSYFDKYQKINQLQQLLAQVEVLNSELAL